MRGRTVTRLLSAAFAFILFASFAVFFAPGASAATEFNAITGIEPGHNYSTGENVVFGLSGSGMSENNPVAGSVRYQPSAWYLCTGENYAEVFAYAKYGSAEGQISSFDSYFTLRGLPEGCYRLYGVFQRMTFNGSIWDTVSDIVGGAEYIDEKAEVFFTVSAGAAPVEKVNVFGEIECAENHVITSRFSFSADGFRSHRSNYADGDIRYIPSEWSFTSEIYSTSGKWEQWPFDVSLSIAASEQKECIADISVKFIGQKYSASGWTDNGANYTATKKVNLILTPVISNSQTPSLPATYDNHIMGFPPGQEVDSTGILDLVVVGDGVDAGNYAVGDYRFLPDVWYLETAGDKYISVGGWSESPFRLKVNWLTPGTSDKLTVLFRGQVLAAGGWEDVASVPLVTPFTVKSSSVPTAITEPTTAPTAATAPTTATTAVLPDNSEWRENNTRTAIRYGVGVLGIGVLCLLISILSSILKAAKAGQTDDDEVDDYDDEHESEVQPFDSSEDGEGWFTPDGFYEERYFVIGAAIPVYDEISGEQIEK